MEPGGGTEEMQPKQRGRGSSILLFSFFLPSYLQPMSLTAQIQKATLW